MKTEKHPLDLTMWSLVTFANITSVKEWRQEPKLMSQGQKGKANMGNSKNLAEKWIWDKGLYRREREFWKFYQTNLGMLTFLWRNPERGEGREEWERNREKGREGERARGRASEWALLFQFHRQLLLHERFLYSGKIPKVRIWELWSNSSSDYDFVGAEKMLRRSRYSSDNWRTDLEFEHSIVCNCSRACDYVEWECDLYKPISWSFLNLWVSRTVLL